MVKFSTETVAGAWDEIEPMFDSHARDALASPRGIDHDAIRSWAQVLEDIGVLVLNVCRDEEGKAVGYAVWLIAPSPIYGMDSAQCAALYMKPERRGVASVKFLNWNHDVLTGLGVRVCYLTCGKLDYSRMIERMGYVKAEVQYAKEL